MTYLFLWNKCCHLTLCLHLTKLNWIKELRQDKNALEGITKQLHKFQNCRNNAHEIFYFLHWLRMLRLHLMWGTILEAWRPYYLLLANIHYRKIGHGHLSLMLCCAVLQPMPDLPSLWFVGVPGSPGRRRSYRVVNSNPFYWCHWEESGPSRDSSNRLRDKEETAARTKKPETIHRNPMGLKNVVSPGPGSRYYKDRLTLESKFTLKKADTQ